MSETPIGGTVAPGWERVHEAFTSNWSRPGAEEVGAAVAVYHRGRLVVDLHGGWFDEARTSPYDTDTLQLVFSTTKGITAIAVAMCVQRGLLDYDALVTEYWPEFAAAGKAGVTVAQLLSHQAGVYTVDPPTTLDQALDLPTVTAKLAAQAPYWEPGTAHGYHALTFGWLAGELVRRVDPAHRTLGRFVADEIVAPLGVEMWIGLPEALEGRVSPIIPAPVPTDPAILAMMDQFMGPNSPAGKALTLSGAFTHGEFGAFNSRQVHAAEIPAGNGIANARSLAKIYAATIGEVDGVRLLDDAVVERARQTVTPSGEPDQCLVFPTTFGMGFMTHGSFTPFAGPGSFGHDGAGGSEAFALPERDLAVAYVMNRMTGNIMNDQRAHGLAVAAAACAGA